MDAMADAVKQLRVLSSLLDNYWMRSQIFRTVQFSSALLSGVLEKRKPLWSDKMMKLSASISNMRVMLRLLDDIPNLVHVLSTWHTAQEVSWLEKLVASLCGQLYYPVEHLAWAADHQLVSVNSIPIWTLAVVLWGIPLLFTLLRKLFILYKQLRTHASPSSSTSTTVRVTSLKHQTLLLCLEVLQTLCDLGLAIFWMPAGFLWGGQLPSTIWGMLGTVSSIIGLYRMITNQ